MILYRWCRGVTSKDELERRGERDSERDEEEYLCESHPKMCQRKKKRVGNRIQFLFPSLLLFLVLYQ